MVQRGYYPSISVLSALFFPSLCNRLRRVHSYCLFGTPVPSRRYPPLCEAVLRDCTIFIHDFDWPSSQTCVLELAWRWAAGSPAATPIWAYCACSKSSTSQSRASREAASAAFLARPTRVALRFDASLKSAGEIRFRDFARWRVSRFGLASNDRLGALVQRFFDSRQFEDLLIPTAIVATDLGTGDPVVFKQGSLARGHSRQLRLPWPVRTDTDWHAVSGRWWSGGAGAHSRGSRIRRPNRRRNFGWSA